jgi:hypothetical protein
MGMGSPSDGLGPRIAAKVATGEFVPNQPYRDRLRWLTENNPDYSVSQVCLELHSRGFPAFAKKKVPKKGGRVPRWQGETSYLARTLGCIEWTGKRVKPAKTSRRPTGLKPGDRYKGNIKEFIPRELANALYEVLEMDPLIEQGITPERGTHVRRHSRLCRWGGGCHEPSGHGQFGRFCEEHAGVLAEMQHEFFTDSGALRGGLGQSIRRQRARKNGHAASHGLEAVWDEAAGESVVV